MELIPGNNDNISFRIIKVMNKIRSQSINYEFWGNESRFKASIISFLIREDDQDVGFMYLTDEQKPGMLFLDISIIKSYRARGLGYEAIKELLKRYNNCGVKQFILAEVENDNTACLNVMKKLGAIEISEKHFLLQPERLVEFKNYIVNESVELMRAAPKLKDVIEMIHEKNGDNKNPKVKRNMPIKNDK